MPRTTSIVVALISLMAVIPARTRTKGTSDIDAVKQFEQNMGSAMVAGDVDKLSQLYSDNFATIRSDGRLITKEILLTDFASFHDKLEWFGEKGIRVNSLSPGMIATEAFAKFMGMEPDLADDHPEYAEGAIGSVAERWQPLQSVGSTDDIAQAALFLASDAPRFVTGQNLVVDGGISAGWPIATARPDRELFFHAIQENLSAHFA